MARLEKYLYVYVFFLEKIDLTKNAKQHVPFILPSPCSM